MENEAVLFENTKKKILAISEELVISNEKSYFFTYGHFIKFFKDKAHQRIKDHDIIIGISFVYSWMQRIPTIKMEFFNEVPDVIKKARSEDRLDDTDLERLQKCFNNSLVSTSKLLHFINPEKYAIWDSRVNHFLKEDEPSQGKAMKKAGNYIEYLDLCDKLIQDDDVRRLIAEVKSQVKKLQKDSITAGPKEGADISDLRALELIFFTAGKKTKANKKQTSLA
jgi:hypothetical protein